MTNTINNAIPLVPENTIDQAAGLNEALNVIDAITQVRVVSVGTNTPAASPADGARYIIGTAPTGLWAGKANQMARWLNGYWSFFVVNIVVDLATNTLKFRKADGTWS